MPPLRDKHGKPTRFALTAAAWGEPVPKTVAAARKIAAKGQGNLALGEAVEIDLHFQEQNFNAVAIVRHTSDVHSGFEFLGMTSEERAQIVAIISCKPEVSSASRLGYQGSPGF